MSFWWYGRKKSGKGNLYAVDVPVGIIGVVAVFLLMLVLFLLSR